MIEIELIIDSRETSLYNEIMSRELDKYKEYIKIKKEQLEVADIHIKYNDNIIVYERKTVRDLLSSIKDARYKEQKCRLLSNYDNINYIIEGDDIISTKNSHNINILSSIYLHSIYRDNIKIFFTKNINETATFLLILITKLCEAPEKFISNNSTNSYIDNCRIKTKKIENIDKETCYLLQLAQIPGISKEIAKNIKDTYSTMKELFNALDNSENKIELLMKIPKIGKLIASRIIEYLYC